MGLTKGTKKISINPFEGSSERNQAITNQVMNLSDGTSQNKITQINSFFYFYRFVFLIRIYISKV